MRGTARAALGERQGLEDMRRALALAIEQGQGRAAAVLHNNLAIASWQYEGPQAALDACREGIDFCERRGIAEFALDDRRHEHDLPRRARPAPSRRWPRQARWPSAWRRPATSTPSSRAPCSFACSAERGAHEHAPAADELLATARESGQPQLYAMAFTAAARLLLAQGHRQQANALLVELAQVPDIHADPYYAAALPDARAHRARPPPARARRPARGRCRAAHAARRARAPRLPAPSSPRPPATTRRRSLYAEAAERWREFGNVPERAYALLGQGRCLTALGQPEAREPLGEARELFASMGYRPALAETDALLEQTTAAAS